MMREYKRYEEYKDSGVEWIGEIPNEWDAERFRTLIKNIQNGKWGEEAQNNSDDIYCVRVADYNREKNIVKDQEFTIRNLDKSSREELLLEKDDLLLEKSGGGDKQPVGFVAQYKSEKPAIYANFMAKIEPRKEYIKTDYLKYVNVSVYQKREILKVINQTTGIQNLDTKRYLEIECPLPSKSEQQKIASFLDQKTDEIDEIIMKKEKLIDHLEKYKKSVITEAVTKGKLGDKYINENGELVDEIEMKDSGIEWISEIPDYWEVNRVKFNNLINPNKSEINYKDMEVSFVPMEYIKDGVIEDQDTKNIDEVYDGYSYFTEQDILLAKVTPCFENNNIGIASGLKNGIGFGTTEVHVIRALNDFNQYIFYLFQSKYFKNKGKSVMYGAGGLKRVPTDFVENYFYGRPKYEIQKLISNYLDRKINQIYNLIQKTKESIEKYKEYKKSLIFEAVTGKIDLRDYELEGGEELAEHNNSSETERECISAVD